MSAKPESLIELKGAMLPVLSIILRSLDLENLRQEAKRMFGDEAFFDGELAALDLGQVAGGGIVPDWEALCQLFAGHGLRVVGVRGGSPEQATSAAEAGLPHLSIADAPGRSPARAPAPEAAPVAEPEPAPAPQPTPEAAPATPPPPPEANTIIIDRPLRSGQRVYARGGDVIVLAVVSTGAEVIADGSIHIYAPLRGRALAGASGNTKARIFTTRMEAELVSIAGLYRTFEDGLPTQVAGKPTQVRLDDSAAKLVVEALSIG